MGRHRELIVFIDVTAFLVLTLVFLPCLASDGLQVRVWTDKEQFLLHEPIPVHYMATNTSDSITYTPDFYETEENICITDDKGREYYSHIRTSSQFGYPFPPGETHRATLDVHTTYDVENVGEYTCFVMVWTHFACFNSQRINSNTIKFKVVEPKGDEKEALNLLLEAKDLAGVDTNLGYPNPGKEELAVLKCKEIVNKYPNGVYSPMGLLTAIEIFARWQEHTKRLIPICVRLIEHYPGYYYWDEGFSHLVESYESLQDKEGAIKTMQELIEKHPNTKISERAEYWLEKIEKWEFK